MYKDARRRIEDPWLIVAATLVGLIVPVIGVFIYMLFRPPEYLDDVRERELEIRAMEERLSRRDLHCPVCRSEVDVDVPRLSDLHDEAQAGLHELQAAARGALAGLPVLRDAGRAVCSRRVPATPRRAARRVPIDCRGRGSRANADPDQAGRRPAEPRRRDPRRGSSARGFTVRAGKLLRSAASSAEQHYEEHSEKPFFGELVDFITSAPTWALVVEGEGAIATMRKTIGATNPGERRAGTIRGDLATAMPDNLVHGSDSPASAEREIALWFSDDELV